MLICRIIEGLWLSVCLGSIFFLARFGESVLAKPVYACVIIYWQSGFEVFFLNVWRIIWRAC